ncbi:SatD family protein [Terriglobus roseus]|uniref:SatD family (SatD) n=1 Tax=Terriglobus roseus TaxID=392734 RepID=A0A1H4K837_9BACT|nr:SatD family protein [Terriglobus roseus]SEB54456.1 SatD family (SatD) [Terriglobus roseus]
MAKSASKIPSDRFIALIGDMVKSRDYKGTTRLHIQEAFNRFIARLNRTYRPSIRALFTVTLGDEFQGLVQDPEIIPDLLWEVQREPSLPPFRLGLGYGRIDTKIPARAINLDGPAFHNARAAIQQAKIDGITGAVFQGFGKPCDVIANGIARMLELQMDRRSEKQLEIMDHLRHSGSQREVAAAMQVSPQAISEHKKAAGWEAFRAGEAALREALLLGSREFTT